MTDYKAPVKDMLFAMKHLAGLDQVAALPGYEEASEDLVTAIVEEAACTLTLPVARSSESLVVTLGSPTIIKHLCHHTVLAGG